MLYSSGRRRQYERRLRLTYTIPGVIGLIALIALWVVVYVIPISTGEYLTCTYALRAVPGVVLPILDSVGCLSAFLVLTIMFGLFCLIYHIIGMNLAMSALLRSLGRGRYDNRYRWVARGATIPIFLMVAMHVSGMRSIVAIFVFMLLSICVEMLRWVAQRHTYYRVGQGNSADSAFGCPTTTYKLIVVNIGLIANRLALFFALVIFLTQLVYWVTYIAQDAGAVPLVTWLYGPAFIVYYLAFAIWSFLMMSAQTLQVQALINLEYAWIIYDAIGLFVLTGLAVLGTIF